MAKRNIRVCFDGVNWIVKKEGTRKIYAKRNTRKQAYEVAIIIALNRGLMITVCFQQGGIQAIIDPKKI